MIIKTTSGNMCECTDEQMRNHAYFRGASSVLRASAKGSGVGLGDGGRGRCYVWHAADALQGLCSIPQPHCIFTVSYIILFLC